MMARKPLLAIPKKLTSDSYSRGSLGLLGFIELVDTTVIVLILGMLLLIFVRYCKYLRRRLIEFQDDQTRLGTNLTAAFVFFSDPDVRVPARMTPMRTIIPKGKST
jgi:hypothetical protein